MAACWAPKADAEEPDDTHWAPESLPPHAPILRTYADSNYSSHFLTLRDGVRVAVDVQLPPQWTEGEKIGTHTAASGALPQTAS